MATVICLRHFETSVNPDKPAAEWTLSDAGRTALEEFGEEGFLRSVEYLYSSPEPKALQAAELAAMVAGIQVRIDDDLREVERGAAGYVEDREAYSGMVEQYFRTPEVPFGWENRCEVEDRIRYFAGNMTAHGRPILIVSHGIILSTMLAPILEIDPFEFWSTLEFGEAVRVESGELERHWQWGNVQ